MLHNASLGYAKPLYILPFDHRSSFAKKMFGAKSEKALNEEQRGELRDFKQVIYEGFKFAVANGVPKEYGAILTDEEFGDEVLRDAVASGYTVLICTEKSGQDEYEFEYGGEFGAHIEKYKPTFAKALVRYNPEGDQEVNKRQRARLKTLSDYSHGHGYKFLIEPLIPATPSQLESVGGDESLYDSELRPALMVRMIEEMQNDGVEPDIWKIEGLEDPKHYEEVVRQAKSGGRKNVNAVVLGRGADAKQVEKWLRAGKQVQGMIGFAIGRTIFWDPLVGLNQGKISREEAVKQIGENYLRFYKVFTNAA